MTTLDAPVPSGEVVPTRRSRQNDDKSSRRLLLGIIALLLALLLLMVAEVAGAFGYRILNGIAQIAGVEGIRGEQGLAGANGAAGANGKTGSDGQPGSNGTSGASGQDGADGQDGAPGTVLLREQGVIGFGACDADVSVSLSSRIDILSASFFVDTVHFDDVASECWGKSLDVYLFSGSEGEYQLESTAVDVPVPNSGSFDVSFNQFAPQDIPSSTLTKLAIEIAG
jgi:hypothetical protein